MSPSVQKDTLVDHVTQQLRQMIMDGEIAPGEYLPSRKELAEQFGVGLSTVHAAVQALTAVGMLQSRAGKGTWVRGDALDTLIPLQVVKHRLGDLNARGLYKARTVIEVGLAELAAQRATAQELAQIWEALQAMQEAEQDDLAFVEADLSFHLAVARAGHNALLEQFYHLSRELMADVIIEMIKLPDIKPNAIRLQRAIAQAIQDRDPQAARQATIEHMAIVEHMLDELEQRDASIPRASSPR
jgi:GntR family transcriptional regulator, transcriptional repressor for pyruvate dehydrogenase complex